MNAQNQSVADCKFLESTKSVGPSRYSQMTPEIYMIFERWGIDGTMVSPLEAIAIIREKSESSCFFCSKHKCQNQCVNSDWELDEFGPAFEHRDEFECPRCSGSGEVPTESHECYLGQQYKPCPNCGGVG